MQTVVVFFALEAESGCFEDMLSNTRRTRAEGFSVLRGQLGSRENEIFVVRTGVGKENAQRAAQAVLQAHRPDFAVSAGFAGGLVPELKKNDLFFPTSCCDEEFRITDLDALPDAVLKSREARENAVQGGRLLTYPHVVEDEAEKQACGAKYGAKAADMETFVLAEACRDRAVPLYCVRAISDSIEDKIPQDIQKLMHQKTFMSQLGAAFRTAVKRPRSVMDMAKLRAGALKAGIRLSEILEVILKTSKMENAKEQQPGT